MRQSIAYITVVQKNILRFVDNKKGHRVSFYFGWIIIVLKEHRDLLVRQDYPELAA